MPLRHPVPELAQRVQTSRELAGQLGPVAFSPLAAISLFVIYLAVGYGVFGRREEIGLVALRGVATPRRWLLATGETVLPILIAAPAGYLLGYLGVALVVRARLGGGESEPVSVASLPYAAVALVTLTAMPVSSVAGMVEIVTLAPGRKLVPVSMRVETTSLQIWTGCTSVSVGGGTMVSAPSSVSAWPFALVTTMS